MSTVSSISRVGVTEPFELQVSREQITFHSVRNIFGYQVSGDTTLRPLWEVAATNYTYPTQGLQMTVDSTSGSDDGIVVKITGLNEDYEEISETVTLNDASNPVTTNEFFRINDVVCISGGNNVGVISVKNALVTYAGIRAGDGRNQASIYTVPKNHCFYLLRIDAFSSDSTAQKPAIFRNFTRTSTGQIYNTARTTFLGNMNIQRRLPFKYSEKTDIQLQVATNSGTHELGVFAEGFLIKEIIS